MPAARQADGADEHAVGDEAAAFVEAHRREVAGGHRQRQHLHAVAAPGLADQAVEQVGADAATALLGPDHHADDVADVAALAAPVALATGGADEMRSGPGAEDELAAVAAVEAEPLQVVGGLPHALLLGVGGERLGM